MACFVVGKMCSDLFFVYPTVYIFEILNTCVKSSYIRTQCSRKEKDWSKLIDIYFWEKIHKLQACKPAQNRAEPYLFREGLPVSTQSKKAFLKMVYIFPKVFFLQFYGMFCCR